jgi:hypothetical protein
MGYISYMTRSRFILKHGEIRKGRAAIVAGLAVLIGFLVVISHAAGAPVASEAESGTITTPATVVANSSASGGSAVKFGPGATATPTPTPTGGGVCNNPFASTSVDRGDINIGSSGILQVRNEAWSPDHGPQTIYACSEQSWYVMSNQPDLAGAVQTYPDTLYSLNGTASKTINQYTSITSTFAEAYLMQGNWDAAYDIWLNNFSKEVMIWNEWNGGPGYWATQAKTAVTLNGVPYHFAKNGTILQFFRVTQAKSGSVDILAALKWLQTNGYLTTTDKLTQIEYGVEICSTVGTQRFDTTGFSVDVH